MDVKSMFLIGSQSFECSDDLHLIAYLREANHAVTMVSLGGMNHSDGLCRWLRG